MKAVLESIYNKISGDLINGSSYLDGRIYYGVAPLKTTANNSITVNSKYPYLVYNKISEEESFNQKSKIITLLFQFDVYANNRSATSLEYMASRINYLFNLKADDLSISGYSFIYMKKVNGQTIRTKENNWRYMSRYEMQIEI